MAILCVVSSGLVLHIGLTSCTFPPWTEMSKKNSLNVDRKLVSIYLREGNHILALVGIYRQPLRPAPVIHGSNRVFAHIVWEIAVSSTCLYVRASTLRSLIISKKSQVDKLQLNLQGNHDNVLECRRRIMGEYRIHHPDNHVFTQKLVFQANLSTLLGVGVRLTMAKLRERFWIARLHTDDCLATEISN